MVEDTEIGELPRKWDHLVMNMMLIVMPQLIIIFCTPCFEEFNYGVESKIWHKYFSNSLEVLIIIIIPKKFIQDLIQCLIYIKSQLFLIII